MKMNMGLIRDLLIYFQDNLDLDSGPIYAREITIKKYTTDQIMNHVALLIDAGYIDYADASAMDHHDYFVRRLTFEGHQFLALIEDKHVFEILGKVLKGTLAALPVLSPYIQPYIPQLLGLVK
jgi:hypothetical protein